MFASLLTQLGIRGTQVAVQAAVQAAPVVAQAAWSLGTKIAIGVGAYAGVVVAAKVAKHCLPESVRPVTARIADVITLPADLVADVVVMGGLASADAVAYTATKAVIGRLAADQKVGKACVSSAILAACEAESFDSGRPDA